MASLSDIGLPGVSSPILHPMQVNRFRAVFRTPDGMPLPGSKALTHQIIRTSEFGVTRGITLTFEEDVTGLAGRALQELAKMPHFNLDIEYLDGNEAVIKTVTLKGCKVNYMQYSGLDYAGGKSKVSEVLRLSVPRWEGKKFEELAEQHPTAATLIALLKGAQLEVVQDNNGQRGIVEVVVTISYGELVITWADLS